MCSRLGRLFKEVFIRPEVMNIAHILCVYSPNSPRNVTEENTALYMSVAVTRAS
jgi:hypothetical protein